MTPLAVTMGDPGGIGGEIVGDSWRHLRSRPDFSFFTIDDPDRLRLLGFPVAVIEEPAEARRLFASALPVLPEPLLASATTRNASTENTPCIMRSIDRAVQLTMEGKASAVVTSPVDKKALSDGLGREFSGHTDYLATIAGVENDPVMLLVGANMRVAPVTVHVPLREVPIRLTTTAIVHAGKMLDKGLRTCFGIHSPRVSVAALNPHAGEGGLLGSEEQDVIIPAIAALHAEGVDARGPFPADSLFVDLGTFDAALCMYHDQALIPVKSAGFCVNVTLGLPFIRTSPGHGTARDIAGLGAANSQAMTEALVLAEKLARRAT